MSHSSPIGGKKSIIENKTISLKILKNFNGIEIFKRENHILSQDFDSDLEKRTLTLLYFIELSPFLDNFDYISSNTSEFLSEEDLGEIQTEKMAKSGRERNSSDNIFPIFRNSQLNIDNSGRKASSEGYYSQTQVENLLPYYLLINSYRISLKTSHSLQISFVTNQRARIDILDQIAYIIKEIKIEKLDTPKRILTLYNHVDLFLKIWLDLVENSVEERDFLEVKNLYIGERRNIRDLEIIIRFLETLCM